MISNGFALGAPVEAILSLDIPPKFEKVRDYSLFAIERAGGEKKLNKFIELYRDFAIKTNFTDFFDTNRIFYSDPLNIFNQKINELPYVEILEDFYGIEQDSYHIYLTQLSKGSFGPSFKKDNGKLEIYNICGFNVKLLHNQTTFDKFINNILWHKFSHPIINPLTESYRVLINKYQDAYEYLKSNKHPQAGYGPWDECINEHIIRAISIHLCKKYVNEKVANERLAYDIHLGYIYIPAILEKLDYYDHNKKEYNNMIDFYEELLSVFSKVL